jgi:hypothetical protein
MEPFRSADVLIPVWRLGSHWPAIFGATAAAFATPIGHLCPGSTHVPLRSYQLPTPPHGNRSAIPRLVMTLTRTNRFAACIAFAARAKRSAERKQEADDAPWQRA